MITVETVTDLRRSVAGWRAAGQKVALVPTMGNLHEGHLDLVRKARTLADRVVVTIFVNPLQFGEGEDFASYPRTLINDSDKLSGVKVDLLFTPTVDEMYHRPQELQTKVEVPGLSGLFCGASRAGHFIGVATVVCKLFNMAQPDIALFGEKDYQQLLVIRQMVEDLAMPVEIQGLPTVREVDGLARSSRNGYLTDSQRTIAPALYRQLQRTLAALKRGQSDFAALEQQAMANLESEGFRPDYYAIRRADNLAEPSSDDKSLVILAAAYLGKARLIDNIQTTLD
ncbi:pantoate--beta-alanine ligase [Sedimenticola selenatireducens]|uniref:Pantothenate synthetase n=1 Tax=Sedimenticola selenatireducens TaxID=191960 RepID=A0A558DLZ4_9GAMM|nr:pantoate--beta-alanine ligase [Sedimenticola selenatireducens]TVO78684.1 pantoate--beta-alanine ligase [Sedimenticola selenatireducens]TVT62046.1 MAG: pantoate--beta-alanine ligase [Sedimenticola selenatireducens]